MKTRPCEQKLPNDENSKNIIQFFGQAKIVSPRKTSEGIMNITVSRKVDKNRKIGKQGRWAKGINLVFQKATTLEVTAFITDIKSLAQTYKIFN